MSKIILKILEQPLTQKIWSSAEQFPQLADLLLNHSLLQVNNHHYRLLEIEFYLCSPQHHDQYTHCAPEQLMSGVFYFHRYGNGTYKSGTYKCMDITFGHSPDTYFGVLIRSIQDTITGQVTEGPCRTVNLILSQFNCHEIKEFVSTRQLPLSISSKESGLSIINADHLTGTDQLTTYPLMRGSRIGLSDKYPSFRDLPYRYVICSQFIHKQKSGLLPINCT